MSEDEEEKEAEREELKEKELISDEEFEDMSDEEAEGCVKVVNDVVFDFEDDGEFFAPPVEIFGEGEVEVGRVAASSGKKLRALILTPTRELAMQVQGHLKKAARFTDIHVRPNHRLWTL
jgi:hypothetical protein